IRGTDNLRITGHNFVFDEPAQRVWSDNPVFFTYRSSRGNGHGLEMDLIPRAGPGSKDKPNIAGVRTLRLLRDVTMHLVPEQKPDPASRRTIGNARQPGQDQPRVVEITSRGRFEYVVEAAVATFQNDVHVRSPTGPNEFDTLRNCDFLTLIF